MISMKNSNKINRNYTAIKRKFFKFSGETKSSNSLRERNNFKQKKNESVPSLSLYRSDHKNMKKFCVVC